jgi:chorismate mutase
MCTHGPSGALTAFAVQTGRVAADPGSDPLIRQLRQELSDTDRAIVEAVNKRLKLVARLKRVKEARGIQFLDPDREAWMLQYLTRANRGPLSRDGLEEIYREILDLTKREVARENRD